MKYEIQLAFGVKKLAYQLLSYHKCYYVEIFRICH
jgi:hypothetical protein